MHINSVSVLYLSLFYCLESSLTDMEEILTTLPAPDLRTLAKSLRLSTTEQRTAITEAVLQHAKKKSISSFFNKGNNSDNQQEVNKRCGVTYFQVILEAFVHIPEELLSLSAL